jgi:hypothetical protein
MPKTPPGNSPEYQQLLVQYLLVILNSRKQTFAQREREAREQTGLGPNTLAHVKQRLMTTGTLESPQACGAEPKYNDAKLEATLQLLAKHRKDQLNLTELLAWAVYEGIFEEPVDCDNFSRHLQAHVRAHGGTINTTSTKTIFFIPNTDKPVRRKFAQEWLEKLRDESSLANIVFIDETSDLATNHPKGKCTAGSGQRDSRNTLKTLKSTLIPIALPMPYMPCIPCSWWWHEAACGRPRLHRRDSEYV